MTQHHAFDFFAGLNGVAGIHQASTPDGRPAFYFTAPNINKASQQNVTVGFEVPDNLKRMADVWRVLKNQPRHMWNQNLATSGMDYCHLAFRTDYMVPHCISAHLSVKGLEDLTVACNGTMRVPGVIRRVPVPGEQIATRLATVQSFMNGGAANGLPALVTARGHRHPCQIDFAEDGVTPRRVMMARTKWDHIALKRYDEEQGRQDILTMFFNDAKKCLLPFDPEMAITQPTTRPAP